MSDPIRILGIDPGGNNTGIAVIEVGPVRIIDTIHRFRRKDVTLEKFLGEIRLELLERIRLHSPSLIACEAAHSNPAYPQAGLGLSEVIGVVRSVAAEADLPLVMVQPSQWEKAVTGSGDASYGFIRRALTGICNPSGRVLGGMRRLAVMSEHELAAIGIALHAGRVEETERKVEAHGH